ncbi:MAG: hypothetical protein AAGG65_12180 [Pseudomonadota bacterium]
MRHWLVRVLLNLGALVVAAAVGIAGLETTGSPIGFGFSLLIYFFLAWGLAVQATSGRARVGLGAYLRPLFFTYWVLGSVGFLVLVVFGVLAMLSTTAAEAPTNVTIQFEFSALLLAAGVGLGVAIVLLVPPLVAIVDRPPPGEPLQAPNLIDRQITQNAAQPALAAPGAVEEVRQVPPPQTRVDLPTDLDREETLEELLGLEPTRHG